MHVVIFRLFLSFFFRKLNLEFFRRYHYQSEQIEDTLCATSSFMVIHLKLNRSEDPHVVSILSSDYFCYIFRELNVIFKSLLSSKWIDTGYMYLVRATLLTVSCQFI